MTIVRFNLPEGCLESSVYPRVLMPSTFGTMSCLARCSLAQFSGFRLDPFLSSQGRYTPWIGSHPSSTPLVVSVCHPNGLASTLLTSVRSHELDLVSDRKSISRI